MTSVLSAPRCADSPNVPELGRLHSANHPLSLVVTETRGVRWLIPLIATVYSYHWPTTVVTSIGDASRASRTMPSTTPPESPRALAPQIAARNCAADGVARSTCTVR